MADVSIDDMWTEALSAYKLGSIKSAKDIFSIIAQSDPRLLFNLACLYIEEKNSSFSVAYFQRAYVRYHQGNYESAYKNYSKTLMVRTCFLI
jgi:tetratricopeptide (TPR) repeat protein